MKRVVCLGIALMGGLSGIANAGNILFTFGADPVSAPTSLNSMDPASAASVTNVQTPVGDGSIGFNGGLVYANNLLFGVGNDSLGNASLYSLTLQGTNLTTVSSDFSDGGDAVNFGFFNGLTAVGSTFYAIGMDVSGNADLFQIGNGTATEIQTLQTYGGTYKGLAYDVALNKFYAIVAGATQADHHGDLLMSFSLGGPATMRANLTALEGNAIDVGTHLGGLADAGDGILYDIYTDDTTPNFFGQLEQIDLNGTASVTTLYNTGISGVENAGIAIVPEPATMLGLGCGLLLMGSAFRRKKQ